MLASALAVFFRRDAFHRAYRLIPRNATALPFTSRTMDTNPYEAPSAFPPSGVPESTSKFSREDLKWIATCQRGMIVLILCYFCLLLASAFLPSELRIIPTLMILIMGVVGLGLVVAQSLKVYNIVSAVIFGLLVLIPCLGLLILLMVNVRATTILKSHGIKVGFFGAKVSSI